MLRRFTLADWAAGLSGMLGLIAVVVPWYSYTSAQSRVTVNGFRASLFGDLFFLTVAATMLLLLARHGVIDRRSLPAFDEDTAFAAITAIAVGTVLMQIVLNASGGRSMGPGLVLAIVAELVMVAGAWLRRSGSDRPFVARFADGERLTD